MPRKNLGYRLKFIISEDLWGHDGSLGADWTTVNKGKLDISYLKGVRDTTLDEDLQKEIDKLLNLLEKYGDIEICLLG